MRRIALICCVLSAAAGCAKPATYEPEPSDGPSRTDAAIQHDVHQDQGPPDQSQISDLGSDSSVADQAPDQADTGPVSADAAPEAPACRAEEGNWVCGGQCVRLTACPFPRLAGNTDPQGDWLSAMTRPAHADIASTTVRSAGDHLIFEMELHAPVPSTPPAIVFYGWFVDTDMNMSTGQKYNDIGSDFNVQLDYRPPRGWAGLVYDIGRGGPPTVYRSFALDETKVVLAIPRSAIGGASQFRYVSIDQVDDGLGYADKAPNSGSLAVLAP